LRVALEEAQTRKHRDGYTKAPVKKGELDVWEGEHAWGEG
jgi:hypothetical protein